MVELRVTLNLSAWSAVQILAEAEIDMPYYHQIPVVDNIWVIVMKVKTIKTNLDAACMYQTEFHM